MKNRIKPVTLLDGEGMRDLGREIKAAIPGLGFALFVFEVNKSGISNYISNCDRSDMILMMKETIKRFEDNETFNTPERTDN